jgi:hypothetical protein
MFERNSVSTKIFNVVFRIGHAFTIFRTREFFYSFNKNNLALDDFLFPTKLYN